MLRLCTAYFPPLDYFAALAKADRFVIDTRENYAKQTFRNRTLIVTSQGVQCLSVPCIKTMGNHTPVAEMKIDANRHWQRDHWRSMCTAYNKSPFFLYYQDELAVLFGKRHEKLSDLNTQILDWLLKKLKLPAIRVPAERNESGQDTETYTPPVDFSPKMPPRFSFAPYLQTFPCQSPAGHLSILDLLFNTGPEAALLLQEARELTTNGS